MNPTSLLPIYPFFGKLDISLYVKLNGIWKYVCSGVQNTILLKKKL